MNRPRNLFPAFTFIELLLVIALIALLAGLLLPALGNAKNKAHHVTCAGNQKQLGLSMLMYAGDWDDFLPCPKNSYGDQATWFYAIDPYVLNLLPPDTATLPQQIAPVKQDPLWLTFDPVARVNWRTIKMNRKLIGSSNNVGGVNASLANISPTYRRIATIEKISTTPLLLDGRVEETTAAGDKSRYDAWETYAGLRHFNGANILFLDGHFLWCNQGTPSGGVGGWASDSTPWNWWVE